MGRQQLEYRRRDSARRTLGVSLISPQSPDNQTLDVTNFVNSNADGYDLAFANGQPQVTTPDSTDTSLSHLAATPNDCKDHTQPERLRGRAQRLKRDPQKPQVCPVKIESPEMQPPGEGTDPNTSENLPAAGSLRIPPPWLIVVPDQDWKNNNPTCFSKTYGLLPLGVCDSSPNPLPSTYDLHGKPNLAFSQQQPGDPTQPTQLWQLSNARLGTSRFGPSYLSSFIQLHPSF